MNGKGKLRNCTIPARYILRRIFSAIRQAVSRPLFAYVGSQNKAWLELNESLLMDRDDMELGYYRDLCADYSIRQCCDIEQFNALLQGLGEDAVRTAELFFDEDESITMGGM